MVTCIAYCEACSTVTITIIILSMSLTSTVAILYIMHTSTEREYYPVKIHISPPQERYEIGSQVTFSCTATSSSIYPNSGFPLRYRWYLPDRGSSYSSSTNTLTINSYDQSFGSYYCLIYSRNSNHFLGQGRTTLNIKGIYNCMIMYYTYHCYTL